MRQPAPGLPAGVLGNPKFLTAIFNPDSVEKKRNTEAVETAPNQLAAARITQYTAARTLPLADVRTSVRDKLVIQRSTELAKKEGVAKVAAVKANPAAATWPAALVVSRGQPQGVPPQVLDAALRSDSASWPAIFGVDLENQGYALVKVLSEVKRANRTDDAARQERAQYVQG